MRFGLRTPSLRKRITARTSWKRITARTSWKRVVRSLDGIGVELRYEWNGDLRVSQMFRSWDGLEASANEKRRELEARGWHSER